MVGGPKRAGRRPGRADAIVGMLTEPVSARTPPAWLWPASLSLLIVLTSALGETVTAGLRFQRDAVLDGELWRLVSAHLVHLGPAHALMNLLGLWLIWWLFRSHSQVLSLATLAASMLAMAVGFLCFEPDLHWYVGLSGVLHGLLAAHLVPNAERAPGETLVLATGLGLKLAYEQFLGPLPFTESGAGGPVVVDAHLYGTVGGLCTGALWWLHRHRLLKRGHGPRTG